MEKHAAEAGKETRAFQCPICETVFMRRAVFLKHAQVQHQDWTGAEDVKDIVVEKRFKCETCGNRFVHQEMLRRHLELHEGKVTKRKRQDPLAITETEEKPFPCRLCLRTFTKKSFLTLHINKCHKDSISVTQPEHV